MRTLISLWFAIVVFTCSSLCQDVRYDVVSETVKLVSEDLPMVVSFEYADVASPVLTFSMPDHEDNGEDALRNRIFQDGENFVFRMENSQSSGSTFVSIDSSTVDVSSDDTNSFDGSSDSSSSSINRFTISDSGSTVSSSTSPASRLGLNIGVLLGAILSSFVFQQGKNKWIHVMSILVLVVCFCSAQNTEEPAYHVVIQIPFNSEPFNSISIEAPGGSLSSSVSLRSSGSCSVDFCGSESASTVTLENFDGLSGEVCGENVSVRGNFASNFRGSFEGRESLFLETTNVYTGKVKIESGSYEMNGGGHCSLVEDDMIECGSGSGLISVESQDITLSFAQVASTSPSGAAEPSSSSTPVVNESSIPSVNAESQSRSPSAPPSGSFAPSNAPSSSLASSNAPSNSPLASVLSSSSSASSNAPSVSSDISTSPVSSNAPSSSPVSSNAPSASLASSNAPSISSDISTSPVSSNAPSASLASSNAPSVSSDISTSPVSSTDPSNAPSVSSAPSSSSVSSNAPSNTPSTSSAPSSSVSPTASVTPSASSSSSTSKTPTVIGTSTPGEFLELARTDIQRNVNSEDPIVGRSYDGNFWEAKPDQDLESIVFDCSSGNECSILTDGTYEVRVVSVPEELLNPASDAQWNRLMLQGTFGVTKADIDGLIAEYGDDHLQWVLDQMNMEATMHKSYFRQRVNPRRRSSTEAGALFKPCEIGSRYHRNAFNPLDYASTIEVYDGEVPGKLTLRIIDDLRTEVDSFNGTLPGAVLVNETFPLSYTICSVEDFVGGEVWVDDGSETCNIMIPNPAITFTDFRSNTQVLSTSNATFTSVQGVSDAIVLDSMSGNCSISSTNSYILYDNQYYRFDPRIKLLRNSLEEPVSVEAEGALVCPSVVKSFLNEEFCVARPSCSPLVFDSTLMELNEENLRAYYVNDRVYLYEIRDLLLEFPYRVSPCGTTSRWQRLGPSPCANATALPDQETLDTIVSALTNTGDINPFVVDITLPSDGCTEDVSTIGAQVDTGSACFQHVHPDLFNVYDFSLWVDIHDGNEAAAIGGRPNPIARWAEEGKSYLEFPWHHPMTRWEARKENMDYVGRFGDFIPFNELQSNLQTESMAEFLDIDSTRSEGTFEACGSPDEIENDPTLGDYYHFSDDVPQQFRQELLDNPGMPPWYGKQNLWFNVNLKANDILRQRVAWAISQIIPVSDEAGGSEFTESWTNYYDIFVRNAFGNYRDILQQISRNPVMTRYLSSLYNRAFFVGNTYPDENFAREIMQLFSVGLWHLNNDGSRVLDDQGNPIPVYTNDNILDFARLWTGFIPAPDRGNIESYFGTNAIDPVQIIETWRDLLPKANLESGFIGDRYPVCHHLPAQHWLKIGAQYTFTGASSLEGELMDLQNSTDTGFVGRYTPTETSDLYQVLCAPDMVSGECTFPTEVILSENLECEDFECELASITSVTIVDSVANVTRYYTYTSIPCVQLEFFANGHPTAYNYDQGQCSDPTRPVAAPICCRSTHPVSPSADISNVTCLVTKELMDYETAAARCSLVDLNLCEETWGATWDRSCASAQFYWTNSTSECNIQVQVYPTGQIGVVDPLAANNTYPSFQTVKLSSGNVFRVHWENNEFPSAPDCPAVCDLVPTLQGDTCVCETTVVNRAGFTDINNLPTQEELLGTLFQGAVEPSQYERFTYSMCSSCAPPDNEYTVWTTGGDVIDENTIFQIEALLSGGTRFYLFNRVSTVSTADSFSFRNPPRFMPGAGDMQNLWADWNPSEYMLPNAEKEIEVLLDHLFEHPNTAPFVSYRLIQRLVTSNPSPRYMSEVVNAFRTGTYDGTTFSGKYGDLGAAVAAVLLDREARTAMLEVDPTFGVLREPLVRVIQVFRSMEFEALTTNDIEIDASLQDTIGMKPYSSPSVFGFYLPEFRPDGPLNDLGIVSPEAQLTISPYLFGLLNNFLQLVDNGFTPCAFGYGYAWCPNAANYFAGSLTYMPDDPSDPEAVVDELDLLLTGRRINPSFKQHIVDVYNETLINQSAEEALKYAQKLVILSSEFHATGANQSPDQEARELPEPIESQNREYKAIIILIEDGAADSYNMIVPHSDCGDHDLHAEYSSVREGAAIPFDSLLPITVSPAGSQPCGTFGVHPAFDTLKDMYDNNEALFFANIGALVEPVTKEDYFAIPLVKELPPSLFAHNIMSRSTQNLHPQNVAAAGVFGRAVTALREQSYRSEMYSYAGTVKLLDGGNPDFVTTGGISQFEQYDELREDIELLTGTVSDSPLAETYLSVFAEALNRTESIGSLLDSVELHEEFPASNYIASQFREVSKFIHLREELQTERDVFVVRYGGFDTHGTFDLDSLFSPIDDALSAFSEEMKTEGVWDSVAVMSISEFGRTLTSNGAGTDHGWGGNHFLIGGSVNGGKFLGEYPDRLTEDGDVHIGRGRLLPTSSWEHVYDGLLKWFGVEESRMDEVLPNRENFPGPLFSETDLFE